MPTPESFDGGCHCSKVRFRVTLSEGFDTLRRCDCSFCTMRGAAAVSAKIPDLTLVSGADNLTLYQFNTGAAKHWFCKTCGIYTHHERRSTSGEIGVNVSCLDGISPFDFAEIPVLDGRNHPSDGFARRLAGVLHYVKSDQG